MFRRLDAAIVEGGLGDVIGQRCLVYGLRPCDEALLSQDLYAVDRLECIEADPLLRGGLTSRIRSKLIYGMSSKVLSARRTFANPSTQPTAIPALSPVSPRSTCAKRGSSGLIMRP